jgi:hypothetical protein
VVRARPPPARMPVAGRCFLQTRQCGTVPKPEYRCVVRAYRSGVRRRGPRDAPRTVHFGRQRRGCVAQPIAGQAVVAIAVRADDSNHALEHLASGSGLAPVGHPPRSWPLPIVCKGGVGSALTSVSSKAAPVAR